jgi:TRAP-type C4-dicarboxylate transport system permease small subunit
VPGRGPRRRDTQSARRRPRAIDLNPPMLSRVAQLYYRMLQVLLTLLMAALMVPVSLQIFSRYIGLIPRYIWTEEIARFCFIWIILIGAIIAVRDGSHFAVDLLPQAKTGRGEAIARLIVDLSVFLTALIFILWGWPLVQFGLMQTSEIANLPMVTIYVAWPLAGFSWILFLAERLHETLRLWRGEVTPEVSA